NLGVTTTAKGNALEPLVRRSLQRFNGYDVKDLPFLKGIKLPEWCNGLKLQISEINTAEGFGYSDRGAKGDLSFLLDRPIHKMLIEQSGTRQDGAWFFSDNRYAGSIAVKLYTESVKSSKSDENTTSSDIRLSFLQKDGIEKNKSLSEIRKAFEESGIPNKIKGILRIHLTFPSASVKRTVNNDKSDPKTGAEDVMVYIDNSNIDDFFYEGISDHEEDIRMLKTLIKRISRTRCNCQIGSCCDSHCSCFKNGSKCDTVCKCARIPNKLQ
ncbi:hypothetical protein BGX20_006668, partial [Mortierella sp. AD010]